jgi:phenylalanyl-tRNA synthetase beta chain
VLVSIPPSRSDILNVCDVVEDVAIAYGYDNIAMQETPTRCAGSQTAIGKLTHLLRIEVAAAGYTEMLTFSLCSRAEAFGNLGRVDNDVAVHVANPQTQEFQIARPSLMPGALKVFQTNKSSPLPLRLFEISDVVLLDAKSRTGCRNERRFCALHAQSDSTAYEDVQGLVEYVMVKAGVVKKQGFQTLESLEKAGVKVAFSFEADAAKADSALFPGRQVQIVLHELVGGKMESTQVGILGVVHPTVLKSIDMMVPCTYAEFNIEPLLKYD